MMRAACSAVVVAVAAWAFSAAAQSSEELLKGSKAEIENKTCCGPSGGATVRNPDAAVLAKQPGMASRDGGTLRLKLAGDRALKLVDCLNPACDGEDLRMHRLVAWWPTQRMYVVSVALYEDSVAYLVPERDGRALVVTAPPVLSPSGRRAIALTSNLMAGIELQLIDLSRDPATITKIETLPSCAGSSDSSMLRPKPVWIDDTHVRFEGVSPAPGDNPNTKQLLRIVDGKTAWEC
jgi:hypothetical protein